MKRLAFLFAALLAANSCSKETVTYQLDYDHMVILDAESLAEDGIAEAYQELLPTLRKHVNEPAQVEELLNSDTPSYSVRSQGKEYAIYSPELEENEGESWGRATFAFFSIVNAQLGDSTHRFYAINGGNDLGGIFLTQAQCEAAQRSLPSKSDWPYIPTEEKPWFGQYH